MCFKLFKAISKTDKNCYAIKLVKVRKEVRVERELDALKKLEHRNIVRYFCSWQEQTEITFDNESVYSEVNKSIRYYKEVFNVFVVLFKF